MNIKLEDLELALISLALRKTKGHQKEAAKLLGISPRTIRYRLEKYPELINDCSPRTIFARLSKPHRKRLAKLFPDED